MASCAPAPACMHCNYSCCTPSGCGRAPTGAPRPAPASAGKVVDRHWYNKNKHIYPASRWAPFDEAKAYGKGEQGAA